MSWIGAWATDRGERFKHGRLTDQSNGTLPLPVMFIRLEKLYVSFVGVLVSPAPGRCMHSAPLIVGEDLHVT